MEYRIVRLTEQPEIKDRAAQWFHEKWGIPLAAYLESMGESLAGEKPVPQWYVAVEEGRIIGGMGVAGALLNYVCADMRERGIDTLYLLTDHDSFYERYGWEFLCMARGDGEAELSRMYVHRV